LHRSCFAERSRFSLERNARSAQIDGQLDLPLLSRC
jgi:hypothetical protein